MVGAAEEVCGRTSNKRSWEETPWWNDRVTEAVEEENKVFRRNFHKTHPFVISGSVDQTVKTCTNN
ncbi:unnamed protein product, partial [Timema podura]|nr:unnamed protein product [Timema podura]